MAWLQRLPDVAPCTSARSSSSHNGTFVNGDRLTTAHALVDRDEIRVGPARLIVHIDRSTATLTDAPAVPKS